jgi:hypothetical protein
MILSERDPVVELMLKIQSDESTVSLACENPDIEYFAGLIRNINHALLHVDFAKLDGKGWSIGLSEFKIAWNLILQNAETGGDTVVYKKQWEEQDSVFKNKLNYDYDMEIVNGSESVQYSSHAGDLTFFNSRNYHMVKPTSGSVQRLTVSSFIGYIGNNHYYLWS